MVPSIRRWLRANPRLVLAVLLAFGVELAPPPSAFVSHRHEGGGGAHAHAGRIIGGAALAVDAASRDGFRVARAGDLHEHETAPFIGLSAAGSPPAGPAVVVTEVPGSRVVRALPAALGSTRARAPPTSVG